MPTATAMPTATPPKRRGRKPRKAVDVLYRCPTWLIGPLNEGWVIAREPSRTAMITRAIEAYLVQKGVPIP